MIKKQYRLNFALVGQQRSGLSIVSRMLNNHCTVACHENLLHVNPTIRRMNHVACFGEDDLTWPPDKEGDFSHVSMLRHGVFNLTRFGASVVGFCTTYDQIAGKQLHEAFEEWWREGSFCLIHVDRNPISCFVSLMQANESGIWKNYVTRPEKNLPVYVDKDELLQFIEMHRRVRYRTLIACEDNVQLHYRDLLYHTGIVAERLCEFLQIRPCDLTFIAQSVYGRLPMKDRILNFKTLSVSVPREIQSLFDESELV